MLTAFEPYMHMWGDSGFLIPRLPIDFNRTVFALKGDEDEVKMI